MIHSSDELNIARCRVSMLKILMLILLQVISTSIFAQQTYLFNTEPYKPFNYLDENYNIAGPSYEIIRETCDRGKFACEFKLLPWRRAYLNAQNHEIQGLFSIGKRPDREEWMYFSHPIVETSYGFFVNQSSEKKYTSIQDFDDYYVATYGPSNTSRTLEKIALEVPNLSIVIEVKPETPFKKLSIGRYKNQFGVVKTAVFFNREVGMNILKENGYNMINYVHTDKSINYYIGFPKKAITKENFDAFNEQLRIVLSDQVFVKKLMQQFGISIATPSM